jgi:hypothetical protein
MFACSDCDKNFAKKYNLLRHKKSVHEEDTRSKENEESEISDSNDTEESDLESKSDEELAEETIDPWWDIVKYGYDEHQEEVNSLASEIMEDDNDISEKDANKKAYHKLLPVIRRAVMKKYLFRIMWFESVKKDRFHRAVKQTMRRLRDEDDFESEEAWKAAVSKRKYLFDKLLKKYQPMINYK